MKLNSDWIRVAIAAIVPLFIAAWASTAADSATPMIQMENVPLSEAIKNVARQMGLNYIIHPSLLTTGGFMITNPPITVRWSNVTANEALQRLLKEHGLAIVTNSATTVARVVPSGVSIKELTASAVRTDTNGIIPVLSIEDPLSEAIKTIASRAQIEVTFAPETSRVFESADVFRRQVAVSFRWENITARQALVALLDNYQLVMVEDAKNSSVRIALRTATPGESHEQK